MKLVDHSNMVFNFFKFSWVSKDDASNFGSYWGLYPYYPKIPRNPDSQTQDIKNEKALFNNFLVSSLLMIGLFPIMDTILVAYTTLASFEPALFDNYDIGNMFGGHYNSKKATWSQLIFSSTLGILIDYFVTTRRVFEYMLAYFFVDINTYPKSDWYTNPLDHSVKGKEMS